MQVQPQNDDLVMGLVELALGRSPEEREAYLQGVCADNSELFAQVWKYVQWEEGMSGFLLDPLCDPPSHEYTFEPGEVLHGRFRIVREVARGGMGVVYEAIDQKLERRIAIKTAKANFRKRLPPEARNATEISHPNVCKIFEIHTASTEEGEIDFLTMEFLEGETLERRLRSGPLPLEEARAIARQLCAGLAEAHRNQVIHGDLKSNNVILATVADGTVRAVITDFGLARKPGAGMRTAQSGPLGGTPDYMAPELWKGEKATVASDIYALGVILCELACGRRPQELMRDPNATTVSMSEIWQDRLSRKPPRVDAKWDSILARCLDPDPAQRFRSADEVARALGPSITRRRLLAVSAAVALALFSGAEAYWQATAPKESVHLAVLPFESNAGAAHLTGIAADVSGVLAKLKSNARTRITVIPLNQVMLNQITTTEQARALLGATHVLRARLDQEGTKVLLHAYLTNARSQVNEEEWKAEYKPEELRYVPAALGGLVTGALRLPPLTVVTNVNLVAQQDYVTGTTQLRQDAGIDSAVVSLERAAAKDPDSPLIYAAVAEAKWFKYFFSRDPHWLQGAWDSVQEAERRDADLGPVRRMAGLLKANAGLYEEAIADYLRAIELEPGNSDGHRRLGVAYESNKQLDKALAEYLQAVEMEPDYYRNQQQLGSFYYQRGDYEQAVLYFKKAVELVPDEPNPRYALSLAYLFLGHFAEAETELRFSIASKETPNSLHALGHPAKETVLDNISQVHCRGILRESLGNRRSKQIGCEPDTSGELPQCACAPGLGHSSGLYETLAHDQKPRHVADPP